MLSVSKSQYNFSLFVFDIGIPEDREKSFGAIDTPTAINLSPGLRIVIEAVSCGQMHNMALTSAGVCRY